MGSLVHHEYMRKVPLVTNEIYHIYNRGVNKGKIFFAEGDYRRFYLAALHYKSKSSKFSYENPLNDPGSSEIPRVQILSYCLMPNHFHFLIKQLVDNGISSYFRQLANSYSHYMSVKHDRVGHLFQGRFKNVLIESDEQLMHVSRYIHLNPLVSELVSDLKKFDWFSYHAFLGSKVDRLVEPGMILEMFPSPEAYKKFIFDQMDYARSLERVKHLLID